MQLKPVLSFNYLGVTIIIDFDWYLHINTVTARASQTLGMIRHDLFSAPKKLNGLHNPLCVYQYWNMQVRFGALLGRNIVLLKKHSEKGH